MKTWMTLLLASSIILSLSACGGDKSSAEARQGAGVISNASSVSQLLEDAAAAASPETVESPIVMIEQEAETVPEPTAPDPDDAAQTLDVDLTKLSSTMVYSEVYNMMNNPDDYVGKTVRMEGRCVSSYMQETDTTYYAVIIADATACCAQGLEYLLASGQYPENDQNVTVIGEFETYEELGYQYCRLKNARLE